MEILSPGSVSVGWALTEASPDAALGGDEASWGYDGSLEEKINAGISESYGKKWAVGDIVGVFLDTNDRTIGETPPYCRTATSIISVSSSFFIKRRTAG